MENFTAASFASILGEIFLTRKDVEQFLKSLKEQNKSFASITRTFNGKQKTREELITDIVNCRPDSTSDPKELFSWMVEVNH
jgi:hypothetical protein